MFVVLLTVMLEDIHEEEGKALKKGRAHGIKFSELLFAEDALLITKDEQTMQLLMKIEEHSERYGMKLNKGKCEVVEGLASGKIHVKDGTKLRRKSK